MFIVKMILHNGHIYGTDFTCRCCEKGYWGGLLDLYKPKGVANLMIKMVAFAMAS